MIFWQKLPIFLLFLLVVSITANAKKSKDDSKEFLEFSREDDEGSTEYFADHDSNEISHEKSEEKETPVYFFQVCRPDKADLCSCEKSQGKVDCRKETRDLSAGSADIVPLQSAAISMGTVEITPKYVYLTGNQIEFLNEENTMPGMRASVQGIDFGFNRIEFIDEGTFDKFDKLRKLHLNNNLLKINQSTDGWITAKLGNTLELLNLAYNSIKKVDDGLFDAFHKLKKLILDGNIGLQLSAKTFGEDGLSQLTTISLDKCGLKNLDPDVFKNLPELKLISLIKNPLTSFPMATLKNVPKLESLDLSETDISKFGKNTFESFDKLENLYLRAMGKIEKYDNCVFCGLKSVELIELSLSKKLKELDDNAFGCKTDQKNCLKSIKIVKMNNCSIPTFHEILLPWDRISGGVGIGGNPLNCDSKLDWLIKDRDLHLFHGDVPICDAPENMKGKALETLMQDAQGRSGAGSIFKNIFYTGLTIGLVGAVLVGALYMNKRYDGNLISTLFSRRRPDGPGFNNLNSNVGIENRNQVIDDYDDEFEPRPAAI